MTRPVPVLPPHAPGLRIGLFGGSFNPPHAGHRLASLIALKRLQLDRVWWIVTPGNPLKDNSALPPQAERMAAAAALAHHPRIDITGFEAEIDTHFTYDTIAYLKRRCPQVHFVWIMGADNLNGFHRWQRWREIADLVPIAIIDRPGSTLRAARSRTATVLARRRLTETDAGLLASAPRPAWIFLHGPRSPLSSTQIRDAQTVRHDPEGAG
ncbi:nicotinate-nucleotide adenylyltransferase [Pseudochelatococcus sp. B33]